MNEDFRFFYCRSQLVAVCDAEKFLKRNSKMVVVRSLRKTRLLHARFRSDAQQVLNQIDSTIGLARFRHTQHQQVGLTLRPNQNLICTLRLPAYYPKRLLLFALRAQQRLLSQLVQGSL